MRGILKKDFWIWAQRLYGTTLSRVIDAKKVVSELTEYKTAIRIYEVRLFGRG